MASAVLSLGLRRGAAGIGPGPGPGRWRPCSGRPVLLKVECGGGGFDIARLERYTERARSEVLFVRALVEEEEDEVIVFKGFSSSLMRPTATDASEPVLPSSAAIERIDRIRGPYNPSKVEYIEEGLSWEAFQALLVQKGL